MSDGVNPKAESRIPDPCIHAGMGVGRGEGAGAQEARAAAAQARVAQGARARPATLQPDAPGLQPCDPMRPLRSPRRAACNPMYLQASSSGVLLGVPEDERADAEAAAEEGEEEADGTDAPVRAVLQARATPSPTPEP